MKLCRYDDDRLGVVVGGDIYDVTEAQTEIRRNYRFDMYGDPVIAAFPLWRGRLEQMAQQAKSRPISSVKLLPPVARPSKVMAAPANYKAHVAEMTTRESTTADQLRGIGAAGIFLKANSSVAGASETIPLRFPDRLNEHEIEVVAIIGKAGSNIRKENALDHIAGYCLGLDMTVRGTEDRSFRKSIDGYSPVGPWLVTSDEILDPNNIPIELTVNGVTKQKSNTDQLIFDIARLIEFASAFYTLHPGDYFFTGTPEGVSPVHSGDIITASSPLLGELAVGVG